MTTVLALETATGAAGAAVATEEGVVAELTVRTARRHVEALHPAIEQVMAASGLLFGDLDAVAADVGPGLFTGIRVGVSTAKGLALSLGIPAVAVTSLDAIRAACEDAGASGGVVAVVDIRRGDVAWSYGAGISTGSPAELAAELAEAGAGELVFAGDGALRYSEVFVSAAHPGWRVAGQSVAFPPVASVAVLACAAAASGRTLDAAHLAPCYLREADARINWTTRHDAPALGGS